MSRFGLFSFGPVCYAVPLLHLRKIVHHRSGFVFPRLPVAVAEVLVDGGQLIPLLTLSIFEDNIGQCAREAEYKVFVVSEGGVVAFPADTTCGIVAENKGELLIPAVEKVSGVVGTFNAQGKEFKILDIDFLAVEMTQRVS